MSKKLKSCPFCGGKAKVKTLKWVGGYTATALCENEPNFHHLDIWDEDEAKAVERITDAWNTRESQPCYADEADHSRCKYSVNRGWVERTCKQNRLFNLVSRGCDGEYYQWHDEKMPSYCPHCGARVVDE
ncbi:MAG: Lar family restriction alleviation protein [Eggerthellaceae bacterium]|nr:Lar family restriction alleviation protein [Eggerthellaceae bacterium]